MGSVIKSRKLTSFFDMTGLVTGNGETVFCLFPQRKVTVCLCKESHIFERISKYGSMESQMFLF